MVKTLTIRDDVYNKLARMKREGESFSELFIDMMTKRGITGADLKEYMGILREKEYIRMKKDIKDLRKKISADFAKRTKRWRAS